MTHQFLTTRPLTRNQFQETDDFLYILSKADSLSPLNIDITYTDDTTNASTVSLSSVNKGGVFQYYLNYANLKDLQINKTIKTIEVYIDPVNKITYKVISQKTSHQTTLVYRNSMGGYDTFTCDGNKTDSLRATSIVKRNSFPTNYDHTFIEYEDVSQQSTSRVTLHSGYKSRTEIKSFSDAFHNKEVFLLHQEGDCKYLIPYRVTGNFTAPSAFDNLAAISFQIEKATSNNFLSL